VINSLPNTRGDRYAQERDKCAIVCAPELKIGPTLTIENLFSPARVETIGDGVAIETMRKARVAGRRGARSASLRAETGDRRYIYHRLPDIPTLSRLMTSQSE